MPASMAWWQLYSSGWSRQLAGMLGLVVVHSINAAPMTLRGSKSAHRRERQQLYQQALGCWHGSH